jgi:hypothetical protein
MEEENLHCDREEEEEEEEEEKEKREMTLEEKVKKYAPWLLKAKPQNALPRMKHLWLANTSRLLFDLPAATVKTHGALQAWCVFFCGFLSYLSYSVGSALPLLIFSSFNHGKVCVYIYILFCTQFKLLI